MLTMKAKYALRALTTLARTHPERLQARRIAVEAKVPEKFLEAILVDLRKAGLVSSSRGITGGHTLARDPGAMMVGDIIRAIDGPLAPIRCASVTAFKPCSDCPDPDNCSLRFLMADVRSAMSGVLDQRSLAQFAQTADAPPAH
jgi:Rrf2 family protein